MDRLKSRQSYEGAGLFSKQQYGTPTRNRARVVIALLASLLVICSGVQSGAAVPKDSDDDRMPNAWEESTGLNPHRANAKADPDQDGLKNLAEYRHDTLPKQSDTDQDGLVDGAEVLGYQTDPHNIDSDTDSLTDGVEVTQYGTNPAKEDSDSDDLWDGDEVLKYFTDPNRNNRSIHGSITNAGHRGANAWAPENTIASFDLGTKLGAEILELDVVKTSDGQLVVMHDLTLDRTARGPSQDCTGTVASKTFEQLMNCDVGSWFNDAHPDLADPSYDGQRIPTLDQVFERYGPNMRYYVELKVAGEEQDALRLISQDNQKNVVLCAFSESILRTVRKLDANIPIQKIFDDSTSRDLRNSLATTAQYANSIAPYYGDVDADLIGDAHARGLKVIPYTVDDPSDMSRLWQLGTDGLITDYPNRLNTLIENSGA